MSQIHPEWRQAIASIGMKSQELKSFSSGIWTRLFDDIQFGVGLDTQSVEPMIRSFKNSVSQTGNLKQKI